MTIGERIKIRRKELHISVDALADKLGKNRATIYRYESDDIENLPISILEPLAAALYTTPAFIMGWEEIEEEPLLNSSIIKETSYYAENITSCDVDELLSNYSELNSEGKKEALKRIKELTFIPEYKGE